MDWITDDDFREFRQNLRAINSSLMETIEAAADEGWPSENLAFLRAVYAMNEKACATDSPRIVCTAITMNRILWLLVHEGERAVEDIADAVECLYPSEGAS